jgi:biotin carboxyl carrier protein
VRVELGQEVEVGDELVILESMKMEIPVVAPIAGTVTKIAVHEATQIQEGDLVAVIEG